MRSAGSDRPGVVGVVLVGTTGAQHPNVCCERRGYVQHRLPRGEELLREQIAESSGGLDRPRPILERCRPGEQLRTLAFTRPDLQLRVIDLAAVDRDRGMRCLVRSTPIITVTVILLVVDENRGEDVPGSVELRWWSGVDQAASSSSHAGVTLTSK